MRYAKILALALLAVAPLSYAQVKISDLPAAAAITGVEEIPAVQSAATVAATPAQINTYIRSLANSWTFPSTITVPSIQAFSIAPQLELRDSDSAANAQRWNWATGATSLDMRACNDAGTICSSYMQVGRVAAQPNIATISFGNATHNPTLTWLGTGAWTVGGGAGSAGQVLTSNGASAAPTWTDPSAGVVLANGTFTPTCTPSPSIMTACTAQVSRYIRVGNQVSFSIWFNATSNANQLGQGNITLPIASAFATSTDATGTCAGYTNTSPSAGRIEADASVDNLRVFINSSVAAGGPWTCTGMYSIL